MRWQVSRTFSGLGNDRHEHLLVKPINEGLNNNLVVMTDRRTYHMQLHSTTDSYMASVKWLYPDSDQTLVHTYDKAFNSSMTTNVNANAGTQGLELNNLDFNYHAEVISRSKKTKPDTPV